MKKHFLILLSFSVFGCSHFQKSETVTPRTPASDDHIYYSDSEGMLSGTALLNLDYKAPKPKYEAETLEDVNDIIREELNLNSYETVLKGKMPYLQGEIPRVIDCTVTVHDFSHAKRPLQRIVLKIEFKDPSTEVSSEEYFSTAEDLIEIKAAGFFPKPITVTNYRIQGAPNLKKDLFVVGAKNVRLVGIRTNTPLTFNKPILTCEFDSE